MKRFWFFDLDGTLADTDADIRLAWKGALDGLGLECPCFDEKFVAGPPIEEMARILLPDVFSESLARDIRAGFARRYDSGGFPLTREYPGVLDRVRRLKEDGARVFIVTNKRHAGAMALAEKFRWTDVFEGIYAGDMYKDDPAVGALAKPALLALLMERVGAGPGESSMVGDTHSDFDAARANGVESVGVAWGYGTPEELSSADRIARTPEDI